MYIFLISFIQFVKKGNNNNKQVIINFGNQSKKNVQRHPTRVNYLSSVLWLNSNPHRYVKPLELFNGQRGQRCKDLNSAHTHTKPILFLHSTSIPTLNFLYRANTSPDGKRSISDHRYRTFCHLHVDNSWLWAAVR